MTHDTTDDTGNTQTLYENKGQHKPSIAYSIMIFEVQALLSSIALWYLRITSNR